MRTYRKIGCAARLLCRFPARPSLYLHVLSRGSLRAFAYSGCSPHFEIGSCLVRLLAWNQSRINRCVFSRSVPPTEVACHPVSLQRAPDRGIVEGGNAALDCAYERGVGW